MIRLYLVVEGQLHEFEAYVFVDLAALEPLLDGADRARLAGLAADVRGMAPEDINDGVNTAPSKGSRDTWDPCTRRPSTGRS